MVAHDESAFEECMTFTLRNFRMILGSGKSPNSLGNGATELLQSFKKFAIG
jgi:hypothetical protein